MKFFTSIYLGYLLLAFAFFILVLRISYPYHRFLAFLFFLFSLIPFFMSYFRNRDRFRTYENLFKNLVFNYWGYILFILVILIFLYLLFVFFPHRSSINDISDEELKIHFEEDSQILIYLNDDIQYLLNRMVEHKIFDMDGPELIINKDLALSYWKRIVANMIELDLLKNKYKGFSYIPVWSRSESHSRAFLLAYGAFVSQYETSLKLTKLVDANHSLITFLNEANDLDGIGPNSFYFMKLGLTETDVLLRLNAARLYLPIIKKYLLEEDGLVLSLISDAMKEVDSSLSSYPKLLFKNPLDHFEKKAFSFWFPIQKNITEKISYIKVSTRDYLIQPDFIMTYKDKFLPGDIFVERREWHATNAGIPGYWTHSAMYLGSLKELDEYFFDLEELAGLSFSEYLKKNDLAAYESFSNLDESGFVKRLIESKRPGVFFTSLEYSANGDSLGVLRVPNVSKAEMFAVLMKSFSYLGRPYDYKFDFTTDSALLCSELIYKSYLLADALTISYEDLNGALLFTPNDFVEKFDNEFDFKNPELEFVLFLDGNEKNRNVVERDVDEFRESWKRPKWHILKDYL